MLKKGVLVLGLFGVMFCFGLAQENVTIKWWDFPRGWAGGGSDENPSAWNEAKVAEYTEANPDVTIEFTPVSWEEGARKLDVGVISGEGPDVMYGFPALFGRMLSLGVLAPIDSELEAMSPEDLADFYPATLEFVQQDGQHWGFPWWYNAEGEWAINLSVAEEAGALDLIPEGPAYNWTPEQVLALAQKCTFTRDNGEQVWGIAFATNQPTGIDIWPTWSFARMFGKDLYDPAAGVSEFADEKGVEAFQYMYDLVETYKVAPPGTGGATLEDANDLWNRKQVCIRISSGVEQIKAIEEGIAAGSIEAPFEVLAVMPPSEEGTPARVAGGVGVQMVFDNGDPARTEAALKFANWLTNSKNLEVFADLSPLTARISTTEKLGAGDPITEWRINYVLPALAPYSKHPKDLQISDAWMQALQSLFAGERSPQEAAQWFQDEANRLLQEPVN
jgi:multiple sugar transport system substrate-binding protein